MSGPGLLLAPVAILEKLREMHPFTKNQMTDRRCTPTTKKEEREEPEKKRNKSACTFLKHTIGRENCAASHNECCLRARVTRPPHARSRSRSSSSSASLDERARSASLHA